MSTLRIVQNGVVALLAIIAGILGIVALVVRPWYIRSSAVLSTVYGLFSMCEGNSCNDFTYTNVILPGCLTTSELWQQFQVVCQVCAVISVVCSNMSLVAVICLIVTKQEADTKMLSTYTDSNFVARLPSLSRPGGWRKALRFSVSVLSFLALGLGWSTVAVFAYWYTKGLYCGDNPCRAVSPIACQTSFGSSFAVFCISSCAATMLFVCSVVDVCAAVRGRSTLIRGRIDAEDLSRSRSMAYRRPSFMNGASMRSSVSFYPGRRSTVVREFDATDFKEIKRPATPPVQDESVVTKDVPTRPAVPENLLRPISHQPIFPFLPPDGDWATGPDIGDLFWSETEQIFFDPNSGQFYDPNSEHWYDPEIDQWYHL